MKRPDRKCRGCCFFIHHFQLNSKHVIVLEPPQWGVGTYSTAHSRLIKATAGTQKATAASSLYQRDRVQNTRLSAYSPRTFRLTPSHARWKRENQKELARNMYRTIARGARRGRDLSSEPAQLVRKSTRKRRGGGRDKMPPQDECCRVKGSPNLSGTAIQPPLARWASSQGPRWEAHPRGNFGNFAARATATRSLLSKLSSAL